MTRCAHLSPEIAAEYRVTIPGAEIMETCSRCARVLIDRFRNRQDVNFQMLRAGERAEINLKADDQPPTPASDYERVMIKQLSRCSLRVNSFDKSFLQGVNHPHTQATMLTSKGRSLIALLMWRYRGQLPAFGERDQKYLEAWLQGKERAAFLARRVKNA